MKRNLRRVVYALLLAVLVYGAFVAWTSYDQVSHSLEAFRWSSFAAALGLATLNYGLRFLKWEYYLARLDIRGVGKLDSFLVFLSGFVLTVTPGKVGEVFKSAVLAETHGVPAERTAPIVVAERLTDVVGVVALVSLGSAGWGWGWAVAGGVLVALVLAFVLSTRPVDVLVAWAERGPAFARRAAPKLRDSFRALRVVASPTALLWPSLISIVAWGAEGYALFVLLTGFGAAASLPLATFAYATATLAGALVPVPGGLGVSEGIIYSQLVQLGQVPQGIATAAMILIRFATLWWAVIVGFAALGVLKIRHPGLLSDGGADAAS